jgi:hypothetical protein
MTTYTDTTDNAVTYQREGGETRWDEGLTRWDVFEGDALTRWFSQEVTDYTLTTDITPLWSDA